MFKWHQMHTQNVMNKVAYPSNPRATKILRSPTTGNKTCFRQRIETIDHGNMVLRLWLGWKCTSRGTRVSGVLPNRRLQKEELARFSSDVQGLPWKDFSHNCIGKNGPVACQLQFPDLIPMDFFFCGYIKSMVYNTPLTSDIDLVVKIIEEVTGIRKAPA